MIVIILTLQQIQDQDPCAWLTKAESRVLADNKTFMLDTGTSLYVPFGMVPIIIGMPSDENALKCKPPGRVTKAAKAAEREFATYTLDFLFDAALDSKAPAEARRYVASSWVKATNWLPATFRNSDVVKQWFEAIHAADAAETAGEA